MSDVVFGNILGGVNYQIPPNELPKYFLADGRNVLPNMNGYATKRGGSSKLNTTAYGSIITSIHELVIGSTSYRFAAQGMAIGLYNSATGSYVSHITGLTDGAYGQWLNYGDYAIYVNGIDNPQKSNGVTGNDLTTGQSGLTCASCIAEWGERIWTAIGAKLYGSALRAETDFSTTTVDIGYWEGNVGNKNKAITWLFPFFDQLLIGKQNQVYMLTGAPETASSTFRLTPLYSKDMDSIGFTAPPVQVGNDAIFLDGFDIKRLSGITQYGDVESVSIIGNIRDFFKSSSGAGLDKDYLQNSRLFHYKHKEQVWCTVPTGANTRFWFVIDYSNRELRAQLGLPQYSMYPMYGITPISFGGVEDGTKLNLYAGFDDGYVRQLDIGSNDDNSVIDSHCTWGFGSPIRRIQPVHVGLNVKYSGACTLRPYYAMGLQGWEQVIDADNFTALASEDLTDSSWLYEDDPGSVYKKMSGIMFKSGRSFLYKLRNNTGGQNFEIRPSYFSYRLKDKYH